MIIATVAGVPMYADIFGTTVAEALLAKGAQLGVALSFMMGVHDFVPALYDHAAKGGEAEAVGYLRCDLHSRYHHCRLFLQRDTIFACIRRGKGNG